MSKEFQFISSVIRPYRKFIIIQFMIAIIWSLDISLRPYILKIILDRIQMNSPENVISNLKYPVSFYLLMSLLITIAFRVWDYVWLRINSPLERTIGNTLMNRMMHHSQSVFQNQFAGSLANKIKDVMKGIPDIVKIFIDRIFSHCIALPLAIITVWTVNSQFAILLTCWMLIYVAGSIYFSQRLKTLSDKTSEIRSSVIGNIVDVLSNMTSVNLFSSKEYESKKLGQSFDSYVAAHQKMDWFFLRLNSFQGFTFIIYLALSLFLLIYGVSKEQITAGDFALIVTVNISLINSLWSLSTDISRFAELRGNVSQGLRIVLSPIDIEDKNENLLTAAKGEIIFDRVHFSYSGSEPLFTNKSLKVNPGEKIGLVGHSGGGKTTFVNLILRLYEISDGRILIDGQNIQDVTQESLRKAIAMIPQDPSLFHRTLMENIRYGKLDATDDEVIEASKEAHAHEFITRLPLGYDSLVGERGIKLSGGQRQRIAIARAIIKNAPILILDEATSQLDSITESYIQESLWKLMQDKTTIVIAHRLATLLHMDRILVFDKGMIVEDGSHEMLLEQGGIYKNLWDAQVGGFLPDF